MEARTNQELETFGSYLQSFRKKRKLAIETVAEQTKIAAHCLRAIEANDHAQLPAPAYVRGFIRTYAGIVGANADLAVNLYVADLKQEETIRQQRLRKRAKLGAVKRALLAVAVIVSILLLLRYTDIVLDSVPSNNNPAAKDSNQPAVPADEFRDTDRRFPSDQAQTTLNLKVIAVEQTWLKVIVDGHNAKSYELKPEDRLELEGSDNFNLMIGNATGLEIYLNDRPVKIFGDRNQVVSLKLP